MPVENAHVWSSLVISIIVYLQLWSESDAAVSGKTQAEKGLWSCAMFHTPLFLACTH